MATSSNAFDLSDVRDPFAPEDTLDDVLAIAAEVLAELGEDPVAMRTRIGRLSQWLVLNVGGEPHQTERITSDTEQYKAHEHAYSLVRCGSVYAVAKPDADFAYSYEGIAVGDEAARAFAVSMLRAVEQHERTEAREARW